MTDLLEAEKAKRDPNMTSVSREMHERKKQAACVSFSASSYYSFLWSTKRPQGLVTFH